MKAAPPPKKRNAPKTKADILAAAQKAFAEVGYAHAGIRDIAAIAGVSSTLLLRYFGSKAGLFEAALVEAMSVGELFELQREQFGERLAAMFMDRSLDIKAPSLIALSTVDVDARDITTRVTEQYGVAPLARWLGGPDARVRALEIFMLSTSFVLYTRQLPQMFATRGVDKKMAKWFAATVQAIVDQS
ncbi:TetR/AcrR family transcriptional regulator [Solimonas sp. K1W22B-7]|uniref:TetR family transcriptional regulator n=1 Tax=Solimonas sp. K1W22B-7 TaxID=2303331 RepID=UPI000E336E16|nr:TetR family transcriptional regulator [Solimonas sp. K1W22B-7]AXQ31008.1 TetR/AcrR family transcriptional regulator [Solimonas sp. K1W22B-7]